jgi:hypothetical protein
MRLWVFKRHFSTIFQLYIDLWTTFPGANMVQDRNTLGCDSYIPYLWNGIGKLNEINRSFISIPCSKCIGTYSTLQVYPRSYSQVGHIPPKMSDSLQRNVRQIWESVSYYLFFSFNLFWFPVKVVLLVLI